MTIKKLTNSRRNEMMNASKVFLIAFCVCPMGVTSVTHAQLTSSSSSQSRGSDWWGDTSGWVTTMPFGTNPIGTAPSGTWKLQYKHWFGTAKEPAKWSNAAFVQKPAAADYPSWPGSLDYEDNHTTSAPGSPSDAKSSFEIEVWKRNLGVVNQYLYTRGTKSEADASKATGEANSKSQIVDPYEFSNPDPGNKWTVLGAMTMLGSLNATDLQSGDAWIEARYSIAIDSRKKSDAHDILRVHIGLNPGDVAVDILDPNVHLFLGDQPIDTPTAESLLLPYYLPDGGYDSLSLIAGMANVDAFGPDVIDDPLGLPGFGISYLLDGSVDSATLFVDNAAFAEAAIPEPATLALLGLAGLVAGRWRRRRQSGQEHLA